MVRHIALLLCVCLSVLTDAQATTVTLQQGLNSYTGVTDTYISSASATTNFGTATTLQDQTNAQGLLVKFNIFQSQGGPVPNTATIQSATLSLYNANGAATTYGAYRLLKAWNETQATWNKATSTLNWSTAGATGSGTDRNVTADGTAATTGTAGWLNFTVTSGVTAMATTNNGWRLIPTAGATTLKTFNSGQFTTNTTLRPKLAITYASVPGAPTIGTATAGNAQATVSFTAPASDGGSPITGYTVTASPGGLTATGTASPLTVTGLTNGTAYTFTVKATNAIGSSAASTASNSVTTATVPTAPAIGTATAGNAQATVNFTAPTNNGGSVITSYTVTSSPGGLTATGAVSPITVTGLTNGTAYTFTVKATNAMGSSSASAASNSVNPATVPGAPIIGTATAGNAQAAVSFTAPSSNGGSAITGYTVTSSPGGLTAGGTASPLTVSGLTNGTTYTFTVKAINAIGSGAASTASNSVTPATVPGAPTVGTATAGNAQATVSFTAPSSNGGSAITGYTVTSSPGGLTVSGSASPLTVTGLNNGTAYTFTVKATNVVGSGAASAASNSVTPATVPGAPTIGTATAGNAQANVSFTTPASNGGSAITGYTLTSSPGGLTASGTASPITITGLTNGTEYTFAVTAANAVGTSVASGVSNSITPATVPDAPTIGTATAGNAEATVTFAAPTNSGGSAVTGYIVTSSPDGLTATGTASPLTVTGLTNGTTYSFSVKATNAVGVSADSALSNSVTPSGTLSLYFIHPDHLGTPRLIADSQGTTVWTWDNTEPFSNSTPNQNPSGSGNFTFNLRFPGQYYDAETGLHYNYFRDYDPKTGRYVESDPIGLLGGVNTYAYVDGNPQTSIDFFGLDYSRSWNSRPRVPGPPTDVFFPGTAANRTFVDSTLNAINAVKYMMDGGADEPAHPDEEELLNATCDDASWAIPELEKIIADRKQRYKDSGGGNIAINPTGPGHRKRIEKLENKLKWLKDCPKSCP
jgi:trimeric autotransporter adhesin